MAHVAPIYPSFARGEVSPLMLGRIDIEQYPTCLEKCRNAYIRPYGCITRLTGTEFISQTKNSGKVRLLKFVFSPTDSYIIECGAGYFRFYQNGAPVTKNGNIYEISNSYYEDQLDSIQYVQLDDIIKLTCLPHNGDNSTAKPKELIRYASDNWVFRNVTFKDTPYLDQNTTDVTMTASAVTGNSITIQASADYFDSGMIGAFMWIGTPVKDTETNKDVQGFVKITGYTSKTQVTASVQSKLSGTTATKLWGEGAFSDSKGYPSVVALYDGRLYYARTPVQPRNVYGSKPYAYETFTPAVNNEDDGGINVALATNANGDGSDIKWMIGASYLLCGTYGGEFVIRGTGDGAITPTDISARQRTNWGGEPVQPIVAGTFVHFLQRNGNKLRQFQYDFYYDSYKAVDVSIFSEHLLASPIKAMALQKNPDSIIYLMREDGNVVMLTLEQDQSVQAWSLLEDMGAKVESIQTIPSYNGNYDEVYMVMNRNILETTLTVTSSNESLIITNNYSGTKDVEGTETEVVTFTAGGEVTWAENVENSNLNGNINTIATDGTKFVIVSKEGYVSTSADGITWTQAVQSSQLGSNNWNDVSYGNSIFVALGDDGYISTSADGTTWTQAVQNSTLYYEGTVFHPYLYGEWISLTNDGTNFIALSSTGYISTSADGTTWTTPVLRFNTAMYFEKIVYGLNKYVVMSGRGDLSVSSDTVTWNYIGKLPVGMNKTWISIIFAGTSFVALREDGYIYASSNGSNWALLSQNIPDDTGGHHSTKIEFTALGYNSGFVVIGDSHSKKYVNNGAWGIWVSQTTGEQVDFTDPSYNITYTGIPSIDDTITFVWTSSYTGNVRYIERMQNPITQKDARDWWYVRSGLKYDGYAHTQGIGLTLSANYGTVTATAASSIFTSSMVGNKIRFVDDDYNVVGEGTITEYTSGTVVTLDITTDFQSLTPAGGKWGISTDVVSNLDHLNGRTVQVFADGKEQEEKTVIEGSIEIDDAFIAVVGLPYTSYITTMPMEAGSANGTAVGKRKRISEMAIRVWNTIGVRVGRDLNNLYDTIYEQKEPFTGVIPNIKYNQGWVWDANITVEQSHPYPMNILSIAPIVTEVDK